MADIEATVKKIATDLKNKASKRAYEKAAFESKIRNMKSDSDVLKEIAKLLFSIDQKLSK